MKLLLLLGIACILAGCSKSEPVMVELRCPEVEQTILYSISMSCDLDWDTEHLVPDAKEKALQLLSLAKQNGLSVKVYETQRGLCRQTQMLKKGTSPRLDSKHLIGEAFDLVFVVEGKKSWAASNNWKQLGELGKSIGLAWGGEFPTNYDPGHFELPDHAPAYPSDLVSPSFGTPQEELPSRL